MLSRSLVMLTGTRDARAPSVHGAHGGDRDPVVPLEYTKVVFKGLIPTYNAAEPSCLSFPASSISSLKYKLLWCKKASAEWAGIGSAGGGRRCLWASWRSESVRRSVSLGSPGVRK